MTEITTDSGVEYPSVNVEEAATTLQEAASLLRFAVHPAHGASLVGEGLFTPGVSARLADWLEGEAVLLASVLPFTSVLTAAFEQSSGGRASIHVGADETGYVRMALDSSLQAVALAESVLARADELGVSRPGA